MLQDLFTSLVLLNQVGIYLPCYDLLREALCRYSDENMLDLKPYAPLLAGSFARSLAVIVCSPLELAKTRMQVKLCIPVTLFIAWHVIQ